MQNDDQNKNTVYPCNEIIRARLIEIRASGTSNNKLSAKLGCSTSVISQWLSTEGNQYSGDIAKWERSAEDFLRNESRRKASGVTTVSCDVAEQLAKALELIRKTNDVGVIMAEAGFGKTRGIELYTTHNPTAVLFRVMSWASDKQSIEGSLFSAVGSSGWDKQTKRAVFLAAKLSGSDRLLIVDDAHKLTRPALQWLFDFADETGIPLALVGTFDLADKIADDAQRFSRVGLRYEIVPEDARDLIKHLVKTHAPQAHGAELEELVELSEQVVAKHGHYRSANKQLKLAAELKENSKKKISWQEAFRQSHTLLFREYKLA
jgi:DNA transposition AAA+ family ATPase